MTSTPDAPAVGALSGLFESTFGSAPDGVWQAPGRVNLIGEHTDYNEGFVLPFAIDKTAKVAVRIRHDSRVRLLSTFGGQGLVEADVDALVPEAAKGWTKYPLGVAWALQQRGVLVPASTSSWIRMSRWARDCPPRTPSNAPSSPPSTS
ncbi:galactokinase [Arthrobacter sp. Hiyo8]|nr:galactokinase [Arthrobacter sp. Hiyo8]